ncbi:MAG: hypothetical protein GWN16_16090 [Calditrichae bacterium]|nr:hypothetical protein [Calditrichia bacterium]
MNITVINDWYFKPDGNINKGISASADLVDYFDKQEPGVQLSLWLRGLDEPLRFFHITVFDDMKVFENAVKSNAIERFVDALYPEIDQSTHVAPQCDVVLSSGAKLKPIRDINAPDVTVINDWYFREDGDVNKGLTAASEYVDWMKKNKPELQLSLWLRDRENPLRFFHIIAFDTAESAQEGRQWEGTLKFVDELFPEIHEDSVKQPKGNVILSSGGNLKPIPLQL